MKKALVLGSINKDLVSFIDQFPKEGETIKGNKLEYFNGGKGANQAISLSRQHIETTMIGAIGNDQFGKEVMESMQNSDVNVENIIEKDSKTGLALININKFGANNIIIHPGANFLLKIDDIKKRAKLFKENDYLLMQLEIKTNIIKEALKMAHKNKMIVVLTPSPASQFTIEFLQYVNYLILNETEFEYIFKLKPTFENIQLIGKKFKIDLIVTLGSQGSIFSIGGMTKKVAAFKTNVKDTTSAGDTFVGTFLSGVIKGMTMQAACSYANFAASIAITKQGAQNSIPSFGDIFQKWKHLTKSKKVKE